MADAPYLAESWSGLVQFRCPACGYDTLLQARMDAHMAHCARFQAALAAGEPPSPFPPPAPAPAPEEEPAPDDAPVPVQPTPAGG
jgi:hypothetical protein